MTCTEYRQIDVSFSLSVNAKIFQRQDKGCTWDLAFMIAAAAA